MFNVKHLPGDIAGFGISIGGITIALKDIQNGVIALLSFLLLCLQVYLTVIRIKKERSQKP